MGLDGVGDTSSRPFLAISIVTKALTRLMSVNITPALNKPRLESTVSRMLLGMPLSFEGGLRIWQAIVRE